MVRLPRNEKQTYQLNSRAQMWPSGLTLSMTLTLNFQGQIWNLLYLSQKWSDCHETKSKHIDWIPRPQMRPSGLTLAMTLTLNFQGQIWNFLYLSQNGFDLHHNLDLWILKVKRDLDLWPHTWPWPWIFMVKFWNSRIPEWEVRLTLHKGGGSRSFMTMTMTIWWPRSGVWIYQIVTGVTSVVGVPSTHLVYIYQYIKNIIHIFQNPHYWHPKPADISGVCSVQYKVWSCVLCLCHYCALCSVMSY